MCRNLVTICILSICLTHVSASRSVPSSFLSSLLSFKCSSAKNEIFSMCENNLCQPSCINPQTHLNCDGICTPGCICHHGYFRNSKNVCVPPDLCDIKPKCSKKYEIFSFCGNNGCQPTCSKSEIIGCLPKCSIPGCICMPGFLRNSSNECILPSQCSNKLCNRENEMFSMCGNDGCQRTCSKLDISECKSICSHPGCVCISGFVRNSLGECVLPSSCPVGMCIGSNEVYSPCGNDGCQRSCDRLDVSKCTPVCSTPSCVCAVPFVKNQAGACVLKESCPNLCSKPNEIYSPIATNACERSCNRLDVVGCINTCESPKCVCSPGYVRSVDGSCILPSQCPPICTGPNEVLSACGNDGCQRSCSRLDIHDCIPKCSRPGCICFNGFVRNDHHQCVLPSICNSTCSGMNEVYSTCGNDDCQRTCENLNIEKCISRCSNPGCVCAPGYVRNRFNQCILPSMCPVQTCSNENEVFSACGNDGCQPTCDRFNTSTCIRSCGPPGCICAVGFVRNSLYQCVLPSDCITIKCTGANQVYSFCGNDGCQRSCDRLNIVGCIPKCVNPACICADGFVKNSIGDCVPVAHCYSETCQRANQVYSLCGDDGCQRRCDRFDISICRPTCGPPACICALGFVKSSFGECVPISSCPTTTCERANQMFSGCGDDGCQPRCDRLDISTCKPICGPPACICIPGFVRNALGDCVPISSCPNLTCLKPNQVYSRCGDDGCQRRCDRLDVSICTPICNAPACICANQFVKNSVGDCVSISACPTMSCTKANQIFSVCGDDGCQRRCDRLNISSCIRTCSTPACICAEGFVKNAYGDCVPISSCQSVSCTKANQIYSGCGDDGCQRRCDRLNISSCIRTCSTPACICIEGFVKNPYGDCVPISSCQAVSCTKANQIYSGCGDDGCQRRCDRLNISSCIRTCNTPACICAEGFVKNAYGDCVPISSCPMPTCTGENQIFSGCGDDGCQRRCDRLDFSTCVPSCGAPACVCANGFVKSANGKCVPISSCPTTTCTGANQIFSGCGDDGCQRKCDRLDVSSCVPSCGVPACICANGFVKSVFGNCVPISSCPAMTCTGPNQVFSGCGDDGCQRRCDRLNVSSCTPSCSVPACICANGFVKNEFGNCVSISSCAALTCTEANQVYSGCGDDGCQRRCDRLDVTECMSSCGVPACICVNGFVRNAYGNCVAISSCPMVTCSGANQIFSGCGDDGCQRSCDRLDVSTCITSCGTPACICATGFVKNVNGNCVPISSCPAMTCTGANQIFSGCGDDGCQRRCDRLDVSTCVPSCGAPACICATGFVKSAFGNCVPISSCPATTCTGANQVFSGCGDDGCQRRCDRLNVSTCTLSCSTPACICANGFVKNEFGNCVSISSCPAMTCTEANQVYSGCGDDGCQRRCDRLDITGCISSCGVPACICVNGFVRNAYGNCVAISSCPVVTCSGANQIFSGCGDDGCQRSCDRLDVSTCITSCGTPACICATGFVKNVNGNCVPISSCPAMSCTGANQVFSGCGDDGCQRTCDRLDVSTCIPSCGAAACICATGFLKNANGNCVPISSCPATTCTGANQVFSGCGDDGCQRRCDRLNVTSCVSTCGIPACICKDGFVKSSYGDCIPISSCPAMTCSGTNQIYSGCGDDGCQPRCDRLNVTGCVSVCNAPACICLSGYVRDSNNVCVAPTTCPPPSCYGQNEVYSVCGNDGCRPNCTNPNTTGCIPTCNAGACICGSGYVRNDSGSCVLPSTCPTRQCSRPNEVLSVCGNDCCQRSCRKLDITNCKPVCSGAACVCIAGFVRNDAGDCVLPSQCPTTCMGVNEMYSTCGNNVCQQTCTFNDPSCIGTCVPGCICSPGYLRNSSGICVRSSNCPTCPLNEQYRSCGSGRCENTCQYPSLTTSPDCNTTGACVSKCFCPPSYIRESTGICSMSSNACSGSATTTSTSTTISQTIMPMRFL